MHTYFWATLYLISFVFPRQERLRTRASLLRHTTYPSCHGYPPFLQENIGIAQDIRLQQFFAKSSFNNHRHIQRQIDRTISAQFYTTPFMLGSNSTSLSAPKSSKLYLLFRIMSSMHATGFVHLVLRGRDYKH